MPGEQIVSQKEIGRRVPHRQALGICRRTLPGFIRRTLLDGEPAKMNRELWVQETLICRSYVTQPKL